MASPLRSDFDRFASMGQPRGADTVLREARAALEAPAFAVVVEASPRGHAWRLVAALPAAAIVVVLVLAYANGSRTDDVSSTSPQSDQQEAAEPTSTPSSLGGLLPNGPNDVVKDQVANGWAPMSSATFAIGEGTVVPVGAWVPIDLDSERTLDDRGRLPVYDKPDGNVIGFLFDVGFAPVELANAPGFDIEAVRNDLGICPQGDNPCTRALIEEQMNKERDTSSSKTGG